MVGDCTWFGTNPITLKDIKHSSTATWGKADGHKPTPEEFWWEQLDPTTPGNWSYDMARVCINRHSRGINLTFMDGSTRKVFLKDLWMLKWHTESRPDYDVEIPWLN